MNLTPYNPPPSHSLVLDAMGRLPVYPRFQRDGNGRQILQLFAAGQTPISRSMLLGAFPIVPAVPNKRHKRYMCVKAYVDIVEIRVGLPCKIVRAL